MVTVKTARPSDPEVIEALCTLGPKRTARKFRVSERAVHYWKNDIEAKTGKALPIYDTRRVTQHVENIPTATANGRIHLEIENGCVIIGGDGHFWPGAKTTAFKGFVHLCRELKPKAVIMNGDSFDGAKISRHPPINWEHRPSVVDELNAVKERHAEVEDASGSAKRIWNLGNHDARFEIRLASAVPEFEKVKGFHLKDHFPRWGAAWSTWINGNVVIKHRYKGGVHAGYNNTVNAGLTTVTNHTHRLLATPFADYRGVRFGIEAGCLSEPDGPQFEYAEDNPKNQHSGFVVLTFCKGNLMPPEIVPKVDERHIWFRGQLIKV